MSDILDINDFTLANSMVDELVIDLEASRLSAAAQACLLEVEREAASLRLRLAALEDEWFECEVILDLYSPAWLSAHHAARDAR